VQAAFFNRVSEIKSLQATLAGSPSNVLVLLGPPSCGKSGAHTFFASGAWD
jgi:AAA+ ATPase superfamily predicted ATPase